MTFYQYWDKYFHTLSESWDSHNKSYNAGYKEGQKQIGLALMQILRTYEVDEIPND